MNTRNVDRTLDFVTVSAALFLIAAAIASNIILFVIGGLIVAFYFLYLAIERTTPYEPWKEETMKCTDWATKKHKWSEGKCLDCGEDIKNTTHVWNLDATCIAEFSDYWAAMRALDDEVQEDGCIEINFGFSVEPDKNHHVVRVPKEQIGVMPLDEYNRCL
jgi:hypothetical protein